MIDSKALRVKRRSAATSMRLLAISGAALVLCVAASAIWITSPGNSPEFSHHTGTSQSTSAAISPSRD